MPYSISSEQKPLGSTFGAQTTAEDMMKTVKPAGKIVVITGGYAGIGLVTTRELAAGGARVIVGARDMTKATAALKGMAGVEVLPLDLSVAKSIDAFAAHVRQLTQKVDILINNAGIMATPPGRDARGYDLQFATNHLGHFHLTSRLWNPLVNAKAARVVALTSAGHRFSRVDLQDPSFNARPYDKWVAYGQSKSANSLFAVELDRLGKDSGVRAFAVHPGRITGTDLGRHMTAEELEAMLKSARVQTSTSQNYPIKTVEQGAATTLWCALSPQLDGVGGVYCEDCDISAVVEDDGPMPPGVRGWAVDRDIARELWKMSEKMLGFEFFESKRSG